MGTDDVTLVRYSISATGHIAVLYTYAHIKAATGGDNKDVFEIRAFICMVHRQQEAILAADLPQRAPERLSPSLERQHASIHPPRGLPAVRAFGFFFCTCVQAASPLHSCLQARNNPTEPVAVAITIINTMITGLSILK